jgi:hypothetical protein
LIQLLKPFFRQLQPLQVVPADWALPRFFRDRRLPSSTVQAPQVRHPAAAMMGGFQMSGTLLRMIAEPADLPTCPATTRIWPKCRADAMCQEARQRYGLVDPIAAIIVIIPAYGAASLRCDITRNMLIPQPDRKNANIGSVIRRNRTAN